MEHAKGVWVGWIEERVGLERWIINIGNNLKIDV